jgi:hypothetical protein
VRNSPRPRAATCRFGKLGYSRKFNLEAVVDVASWPAALTTMYSAYKNASLLLSRAFGATCLFEVVLTPEFRDEVVHIRLNVEAGERDCHGSRTAAYLDRPLRPDSSPGDWPRLESRHLLRPLALFDVRSSVRGGQPSRRSVATPRDARSWISSRDLGAVH